MCTRLRVCTHHKGKHVTIIFFALYVTVITGTENVLPLLCDFRAHNSLCSALRQNERLVNPFLL